VLEILGVLIGIGSISPNFVAPVIIRGSRASKMAQEVSKWLNG
jgi:hypothetical protein